MRQGILAEGVKRSFGPVRALRDLYLTAPYGQVTALVGPNGSGKTTLLLILATLLTPDAGRVRVAGLDPVTRTDEVRARVGWMPDVFGVYDQLTAYEYLEFFQEAYRLPKDPIQAADLLHLVHLTDFARQPVHVLSRGQKQRLALARALVHRPEVLLLDEPASGLDPRSRVELRDILRGLAAEGRAVLISSHILSELEEIADRVVLVNRGATEGEYAIGELAYAGRPYGVRALDTAALLAALDGRRQQYTRVNGTAVELPVMDDEQAAALLAGLVADGVRILEFGPLGSHLESAYLAMTEERR